MNTMPFYKESVRQVQVYLYDISRVDPDIPRVNPDGIYGETTVRSVTAFQKKFGLTPDGRVDYQTWKKLSSEHERADMLLSPPVPISPFSQPLNSGVIKIGDRSELIRIVKIMLKAIGASYPYGEDLSDDDVFDPDTECAVRDLQFINGIDASGIINKETWNALARAYEKHRVPL